MTVPSFPTLPGLDWPVVRSPSSKTVRQESISGRRTILPLRTIPRWSWELQYEFLRSAAWTGPDGPFAELETLASFWLARTMDGLGFGYTDAEDNTATAQGFGQGDGTTTAFQLVRARGGFTEPVYLPTITSMTVAGSPVVQGTDYTLGATGVVTFGSAPANGAALVWNGTFQWLCRFDEDSLDLSSFMVGMTEAKSVKFSSEINP